MAPVALNRLHTGNNCKTLFKIGTSVDGLCQRCSPDFLKNAPEQQTKNFSTHTPRPANMQAVQYTASSKKLEMVQVPIPKPAPDGVIVKVAYSGICGTDLHIIGGEFPCKEDGPLTLGHEFSGTVAEIGNKVTTLRKGNKVVVDPNNSCHCCDFCRLGKPHFCKLGGLNSTIGIIRNGGWAEYAAVPEEQVLKLPDSVQLKQAALCEPISCLAHGWDLMSPVRIGEKILIVGAGIIGILFACMLHLNGHKKVTVSEPNRARLELTKRLNTGYKLVTPDQLLKYQETDPDFVFDVIMECSGFPSAIEHSISLLNYGGKLGVFGVSAPDQKISIAPFDIFRKELTIVGQNINPFAFPKAISLVETMSERYLNYDNLGIKVFKLGEYQAAIDHLRKGDISKASFELSAS